MEHNEWRPTYELGGVRCLTSSHFHTYTLDTCFGKDQYFHKGAIFMVSRPNLGTTTFFSATVHSVEAYSLAPIGSMSSGLIQSWQPPVGWSYKLNFDAMVFVDMEASRFGAMI